MVALLATAGIVVPGLDGDDAPGPSAPPATEQSSTPDTASPAAPPPFTNEGIPIQEAIEIAEVLKAIDAGDPLPYEEDGGTFQNREGLLPQQPLGYYREYTVETPGSPDRGARRLVIGEGGETYYTDDHYSSFVELTDPEQFVLR